METFYTCHFNIQETIDMAPADKEKQDKAVELWMQLIGLKEKKK